MSNATETRDAINTYFGNSTASVVELDGADCVVIDDGQFRYLFRDDAAEAVEAAGAEVVEDPSALNYEWLQLVGRFAVDPTAAQAAEFWGKTGIFLQGCGGALAFGQSDFRAAQALAQLKVAAGHGDEDVDLDHAAVTIHIADDAGDVSDEAVDALDREPTWAELARADHDTGRLTIDGVSCYIAEW